jgi:hypothetical protein
VHLKYSEKKKNWDCFSLCLCAFVVKDRVFVVNGRAFEVNGLDLHPTIPAISFVRAAICSATTQHSSSPNSPAPINMLSTSASAA